MFAGIIEELAIVKEIKKNNPAQLRVKSALNHAHTKVGDSIAINGVCLTVVGIEDNILNFDLSEETIKRTNFNSINKGSKVNLERSLMIGERLHGHFVSGHIDDVVKLTSSTQLEGSVEMEFSLPASVKKYIAQKGSVSLSGISLTVVSVNEAVFKVSIIPHTLKSTVLSELVCGQEVNLEVDMLARYVIEGSM